MKDGVSFVIPAFREYTFGESLDYLLHHLRTIEDRKIDLLVVDDSDEDGLAQMQRTLDAREPTLPATITLALLRGRRLGKGDAVRMGALQAKQDIIFVLDADVPVLAPFIDLFLERIDGGVDIVIGQRDPGRYAGNPVRHVLARGLLALQTVVVFHKALFSDTQCGFKAFRGEVLRTLARLQFTRGGMYDLEYLYAAMRRKLTIETVPVELRGEVRASRINLFRCIVIDPFEIFYFKGRGMLGYYDDR